MGLGPGGPGARVLGPGRLLVVGAHAADLALAAQLLELLLGAVLDGADIRHRHAEPVVD